MKSTAQIKEIAQRESGIAGEASPSAITVVSASRGEALRVALPGVQAAASTEVATDVVEMHGHFTAELAPQGREAPTGSVMTLVIDADTGEVMGEHIGNATVAMSSLGTPAAL